jgi:hypothetical protein
MPALSKAVAALAAAMLTFALAGDASAKPKPIKPKPAAPEQTAQPTVPPQQFFATKGVEPLTPEREQTLKPKTVLRNATSARRWWWCRGARS